MAGINSAIGIASTALTTHQKELDAIADNLANISQVTSMNEDPYRAKYVEVAPMAGGGVQVAGILESDVDPLIKYDPDNPLANEDGYVKQANIDMAGEMTRMIMAQRAFQANVASVERAKSNAEAALRIGQ